MIMIVLDAGHGGTDPGAIGNGMREADLTIELCERIKNRLESKYQAIVQIAPRGTLSERARFANDCGAKLFVSVHINAGGGTGFESYTHPNASPEAAAIQNVIHEAVGQWLRPMDIADRGKKASNFQVLRETKMPAVLLECLFIDRSQDAVKLSDPIFRDGLANEIAWGIKLALGLEELEALGIEGAKGAEPDPCANCQRVNDLQCERDKLFRENATLRQAINNAKILLSSI